MPASGLSAVCSGKQGAGSRVRLDVIRHENGDIEDFCEITETAEMLSECLLSLRELSTSNIVRSKEIENAVHNQETIFTTGEFLCQLSK